MAQNVIFETQKITGFTYNSTFGAYWQIVTPSPFELVDGKEYTVVWDGIEYTRTAFAFTNPMDGTSNVCVGNTRLVTGVDNGDKFAIDFDLTNHHTHFFSTETLEEHTVAIYQAAEEVGIITRDRNFNETEHYGMETVTFDTTDGGTQVFSKGQAVEGVEIALDFSGGDQTVKAAEGTLVKSAVIKKPENLKPENIPKDVEIAGIVGTSEGGGSGQTKALFCNISAGRATQYMSGASSSNPNTVQVEVNITVPEQATIYKINYNSYTDVGVSSYPAGSFPTSVGGGSPEYSRSGSTVTANVTCKGESKYIAASAIVRVIYEMEGLFNRINGNKTTLYADETAAYFPNYVHFVMDYDVVDFSNSTLSKLSSNIFGNASEIYLPNIQSISYYVVDNVPNLKVFDLTKCAAVPTLSSSNFKTISEELEIRVPASLYDSFISAANWTAVASHIVAV